MDKALNIPASGALDFLALGALIHRLDPGLVPFRKAVSCDIHVSGGEFNTAANLADCFGMRTGIATAMVDYPVGDLIAGRVRSMGVTPFYKMFAHDGARGPNMAAVYSDRGYGVRGPIVFYNRSNEAAALLKPGDFDWAAIFKPGVRWFHSGGIFAALSDTTAELIIEAMQHAKQQGAVVSFDLNYREKLWKASGGLARASSVLGRIVEHVDVLVGNEEDLQTGLGIPGPEVASSSKLDPTRVPRHDRARRRPLPAHQSGRDDHARGPLDEPAHLGRRGVDRRTDVRAHDVRAGHPRSSRRRRRLRVRTHLRLADWRVGRERGQARLGARGARDHVPRRYVHGHVGAGEGLREGRVCAHPTIKLLTPNF